MLDWGREREKPMTLLIWRVTNSCVLTNTQQPLIQKIKNKNPWNCYWQWARKSRESKRLLPKAKKQVKAAKTILFMSLTKDLEKEAQIDGTSWPGNHPFMKEKTLELAMSFALKCRALLTSQLVWFCLGNKLSEDAFKGKEERKAELGHLMGLEPRFTNPCKHMRHGL